MKQLSIYDTYFSVEHSAFTREKEAAQTTTLHPTQATEITKANVTEIILTREKADCMQSLLPMLTHLNKESRWLAWIDPPMQLLKQWQQQYQAKTNQAQTSCDIMVLRSSPSVSAFALTEKALRAGTCHAVIAWTNPLNQEEFSKLEDASSAGNSHGIVLRYR